jgi:hypothetical protein
MKDPAAVALGRKGGQVKSEKKRQALIKNLEKARQVKHENQKMVDKQKSNHNPAE